MSALNGPAGCLARGCPLKYSHWAGEGECIVGAPVLSAYDYERARALGWAPLHGGRPLAGPLGTPDARSPARYVAELRALISRDHGQEFARFMVGLQGAINDWKDARDRWSIASDALFEVGDRVGSGRADEETLRAEANRENAQRVYDQLGTVYAYDPNLGMEAFGEPGSEATAAGNVAAWVWSIAGGIAAVLAGLALWAWLDTNRQTARANATLADTAAQASNAAADMCRLDPNSPGCVAAMQHANAALNAANKGVPPPPGPADIFGSLAKVVMWGALAFLGVKMLGLIGEERRTSRTIQAHAEAAA